MQLEILLFKKEALLVVVEPELLHIQRQRAPPEHLTIEQSRVKNRDNMRRLRQERKRGTEEEQSRWAAFH
jgi:hypothetical protein